MGCGYGFFLKLAQEAGWQATGVDVNPRAVAYARDRLQVRALSGDLREFDFGDGSFELVTLWNVLECVPDPLDLMREIRRVLKVGGRVFIRTQNAHWHFLSFRLTRVAKMVGWGALLERHPYLTFIFNLNSFSRSTLSLLIERAGFAPLGVKNSPPIPGDPYLGVGPARELLFREAKLAIHGLAQSVSAVSGGRWLLGPSLEAWGWRVA